MESIVQKITGMKIVNNLEILILRIMAVKTTFMFIKQIIFNVQIGMTKRMFCLKVYLFM